MNEKIGGRGFASKRTSPGSDGPTPVTTAARDGLEVVTSRGRKETVRTTKFEVTNRGGRGRTIIQRGTLRSARPEPVEVHLNGRE